METLANFDYDQFRDTFADIKFLEGKRTANIEANNKVSLFYNLFISFVVSKIFTNSFFFFV